jgi:tRNA threonylcarbamoyladenosine biosynthesis protein TsaB
MKLLALETSTEACSVALWIDGDLRERYEVAPRRHTELVLPWCDALLAEAGVAKSALDAIAVGRGPGAFTGVRLAVALAQGMALALDRPVLPVSTLAALAMGAPRLDEAAILAVIDARMGEFYAGSFERTDDGLVATAGEEALLSPRRSLPIAIAARSLVGIGSGFKAAAWQELAGSPLMLACDPEGLPHAADVARLGAAAFARGEAIAPDRLEPAYLRDKVALTLEEQAEARAAK